MKVSVKSNYKLYVGCDSSIIRLNSFELKTSRSDIASIGSMFKNHYVYETLKRLGWVAASLDFLGNPAGFVRNVKQGLSDFLFLPIYGALDGPYGAIQGVGGGTSSLFRHFAAGTITSITNISFALSRNIEKLADRGQDPEEGLGLSLLGSVAGVVQAPIDALITGNESVTLAAGKGVAGLFIRPIGAVSRLISDTGRSLLSSDKNRLTWDEINESQSTELFGFYLDDDVINVAKCRYLESDAFLTLTQTHLLLLDLNLKPYESWTVSSFTIEKKKLKTLSAIRNSCL